MNKCPYCGFDNQNQGTFCAQCGSPLSTEPSADTQTQPAPERPANDQIPPDTSAALPASPKTNQKAAPLFSKKSLCISAILIAACFAAGSLYGRTPSAPATVTELKVHHDPVPMTTALCYTADGSSRTGTLTLTGPQGKEIAVLEHVTEDCYQWVPQQETAVYLDSQNSLYISHSDSQPVLLETNASWSSVLMSSDGGFLIYNTDSGAAVYELSSGQKTAALDTAISSPYYDTKTGTFYYVNANNALLSMADFQNSHRIKGDVAYYSVLEDGTIASSGINGKSHLIQNESEISLDGRILQKVYQDPTNGLFFLTLIDQETAAFPLYMCASGLEPVLLEKNVYTPDYHYPLPAYAAASHSVYYGKNGSLYRIHIPDFTEKELANQELFEKAAEIDKEKLASGITQYKLSPNNENVAWINAKDELWFYNQPLIEDGAETSVASEPALVEKQVHDFYIFDRSLVYITQGQEVKKLPLSPGILPANQDTDSAVTLYSMSASQTESEAQNDLQIICSAYGDYTAVADKQSGLLKLFNTADEAVTLVPHVEAYSAVSFNGSTIWKKSFSLEDIAGYYQIKDTTALVEFSSQSNLTLYRDAQQITQASFTSEENAPYSLMLSCSIDTSGAFSDLDVYFLTDPEHSTSYVKIRDDGRIFWSDQNDNELELTRLTKGQFSHILKTQKRQKDTYQEEQERREYINVEKQRIQQEKKRQELENRARSYYNNGVYLYSGTRLYSSPNLYSSTSHTTSKNETWSVYSYEVDESSRRIWLKVKSSSGYYWVYK